MSSPSTSPDPPGRSGGPAARRRILLAEDDEDIRSVFEMVLGEHFEVACAESGAKALAIVRTFRPDVLLVDWTLPDASGGELVERLRALEPSFAHIPVVVVSGATTVKALAESIGAVPCPKPCDVDQLLAAIERALAAEPRAGVPRE